MILPGSAVRGSACAAGYDPIYAVALNAFNAESYNGTARDGALKALCISDRHSVVPMKFEYSAGVFVYARERGRTRILFLIRPNDYDLPKGHIEKGESAEIAAHRELKEETGWTCGSCHTSWKRTGTSS